MFEQMMERKRVYESTNKNAKAVNGSMISRADQDQKSYGSRRRSFNDPSTRKTSTSSPSSAPVPKRSSGARGSDKSSRRTSARQRGAASTPISILYQKWSKSSWHRAALLIVVIGIPLLSYSSYLYYVHLLETRISRPSNEPRAAVSRSDELHDAAYLWGSYRPGVYFGLKTRRELSPVFGAMWFTQRLIDNQLPIRHQCEMGEFDQRYTWLRHDGQNFGCQEIHDGDFVLNTSFVKRPGGRHGGDWTARFSLLPTAQGGQLANPVSLLFYAALDGEGRLDARVADNGQELEAIVGMSDATGPFQLTFRDNHGANNVLMRHHLITVSPGLDVLKEVVLGNLAYYTSAVDAKTRYIGLVGERLNPRGVKDGVDAGRGARVPANFIVHQVTINSPFEMDVSYESSSFVDRPDALVGSVYTALLSKFSSQFDVRFEEAFCLRTSSEDEIAFAKAAFSNLIGGVGYFSGHSLVQGEHNKEAVAYFGTQLYTAVPSRSFFPRGFLWDEGFHNLLIGRFNANITKDIVAHWLDTMNVDGWIPREQILDRESRARVPSEFVVQRDTNANPPTLFLPLREIVNAIEKDPQARDDVVFLERIYPRLKVWFDWFNRTQVGKLPGTYRWRGRRDSSIDELNPITLTSGLDDYPRASHPTDDERHVDLRCWVAFAAGVLASIARLVGDAPSQFAYEATWSHLSDNKLLDELHWSSDLQSYADHGLHSNKVRLVKMRQAKPGQNSEGISSISNVRVFDEEPKMQFVDAHGYVSLFPFLLQILDPNSDKLGSILNRLTRTDLLWTDYGMRSLAKTSPLYRTNNRPDSPPYWRGAIWINVNYLAVEALAHYGRVQGPHRQKSRELYYALRKNLVRNLHQEYKRTGYIWEQYDDVSGHGQRAHPFTGWSSLITLIMSDRMKDENN